MLSNTFVQRCLASGREAKRILSWFDGEVRLLAFDAGLAQTARTLVHHSAVATLGPQLRSFHRHGIGRASVDAFAGATEAGQVRPGLNDPPLTLVARLNWTISRCPGFEGVAQLCRRFFVVVDRDAEALLHVERFPPETRMLPKHRLHDGVAGDSYSSAAAAAVSPRPRSGRGRRPKVGG